MSESTLKIAVFTHHIKLFSTLNLYRKQLFMTKIFNIGDNIMKSINPYLNFQGNTEEAFNFYKSVFGGDFPGGISRFKDTEMGGKLSEEEQQKVMHIGLPMGSQNYLMATDALESLGQKVNFGNNFYLAIDAESKEEADKLFEDLSEGGKVQIPIADQFWGDYFGSLVDKFGVQWMVIYSPPKTEK